MYLSTDKTKKELGNEAFIYKLMVEDTESAQNVAQFIKSEIQTTLPGVTIELEVIPKKNRVERMQAGDFKSVLTRWGHHYADIMTSLDIWTTNSHNNYDFWSNEEYDKVIQSSKEGEPASNHEARWEALKKAEKTVMDEAVILPVYQKGNAVMIKKNVSGIENHSVGVQRILKNVTMN